MTDTREKYDKLIEILRGAGKIAVAYSGGVDSSFLLTAAREAAGERVLAITYIAPQVPADSISFAKEFCALAGTAQELISDNSLANDEFTANTPQRCYICKRRIMTLAREVAEKFGIDFLADGTNASDDPKRRPGMRALAELGVRSPLREAGLFKDEIIYLSEKMNIRGWNRPPEACLAVRLAEGERITLEALARLDPKVGESWKSL